MSVDDKTYLFSGSRYVRYSGTYTRVDDRYPAPITPFWGTVVNNIARTGRVDAALVVDDHTYLFSGNQFVRYTGNDFSDHAGVDTVSVPRVSTIVASWWEALASGSLPAQLVPSLRRIAVGLGLALAIGVPLGLLMGVNRLAYRVLEPITELIRRS